MLGELPSGKMITTDKWYTSEEVRLLHNGVTHIMYSTTEEGISRVKVKFDDGTTSDWTEAPKDMSEPDDRTWMFTVPPFEEK